MAKTNEIRPPSDQGLDFVPVEGVREGLLHGEPLPMFLAIDTIASALEA